MKFLPSSLAAAAMLACAPTLHAQGSDKGSSDKPLDTLTVRDERSNGFVPNTVEAGTFRGASIMDVPATVNVITREVLDRQAAGGLYDAVRNTAGVTRQQNGGDSWDQLVIRGITVENRTNYRLNGSLPIMNFSQVPMEDKERVEVLKGTSAIYYGFTAPSGVVNFVTKRAGATPVATLGTVFDNYGTVLGTADVGRRFGDAQQYGLRINAAGGTLGNSMRGADDGSRRFLSAAFDWRVDSRLSLRADFEYDRRKLVEQAGIALPTAVNGRITLPRVPDARALIAPNMAVFDAETTNAQVRADYSLGDDWALTLEAGRSRTDRDRRLSIFTLNNAATGAGTIRGNMQRQVVESDMLRAEAFGTFSVAGYRNELTLGAARTNKTQDPIYQRNYSATQNLYNPVPITSVTYGAAPSSPTTAGYETEEKGIYAVDRIELSPRWQVIAGVRYTDYGSNQGALNYAATKTSPMAAVIHKFSPDLSVYGSYSQGLEEGETAPTGSANVGTRLPPGVSKQKELGLRWSVGGTLLSTAVFDIDRPGYYTNTGNLFTADGRQRYQGIEASAQGRLTRQLAWQVSAQLIDAKFEDIGPAYDGKLPENTARKTASAFLSYDIAAVPGLNVNGGAYFTGRRPVNDLNQAFLGGYTIYSAGVGYATSLLGKRTLLQLNVENAGGKQYWAAAGTRLATGAPRTVKATVKVDL
ncbi:TonB-dependent siderophore receptor [Paracidovorax avenae]|uniref:TonB-dependent siderophore receptor n=1 Tax=Paracidovorax avenae TaxID=80867 RepID=UPI000D163C4F|nr:TonB-dependent siderophore receptor [Paracidovorax avenae]AVS71759.1 TonB-dependent siderophore receptor [Paracidovorax avenae]